LLKKIFLLCVCIVSLGFSLWAAPDATDLGEYYLFDYAYLEGLSPDAIAIQAKYQSRSKFWFYQGMHWVNGEPILNVSGGINFLHIGPFFLEGYGKVTMGAPYLSVRESDGTPVLISADSNDVGYGDPKLDFFNGWGAGGELKYKNSLVFSFVYGNYTTLVSSSEVFDWGLYINPRQIFNNSKLPRSVTLKAIQEGNRINGFVWGSYLDLDYLESVSFGYSEILDRFFGTLYSEVPLMEYADDRYLGLSLKSDWISESPYLRNIEPSVSVIMKIGEGLNMSVAIGYSYTSYTEWEQNALSLSAPGYGALSVKVRMTGELAVPGYEAGGAVGMEGNLLDMWAVMDPDNDSEGIRNSESAFLAFW